jgi:hypothetical protein
MLDFPTPFIHKVQREAGDIVAQGPSNPIYSQSLWRGTLHDLAQIVTSIRRAHAFGRLTIRNMERLGVAHLYFHGGKLVHIVSNCGNADATLQELQHWTHATVRFVRGETAQGVTVSDDKEQDFDSLVLHLQRLGVVATPPTPRVVEGGVVRASRAEQLLTPQEWYVLIEGTRRVSMAVAHLIGPREALTVLRDILDDCSSAFPAFHSLQIAPSGYLQVSDTSQLDRLPRKELLEGFNALITTCQHFCAPIIGDSDAHRLMIQALGDVGPALVNLGVFKLNRALLAGKRRS